MNAWVHLGANFAAMGSELRFQASTQELMSQGLAALTARGIDERVLTPLGERPLGEARNIYDGGAAESHFCAASLGWDQIVQEAARLKLLCRCHHLFSGFSGSQ